MEGTHVQNDYANGTFFGGLALIAISLSLPTITRTVGISEADVEVTNAIVLNAARKIASAIGGISACHY